MTFMRPVIRVLCVILLSTLVCTASGRHDTSVHFACDLPHCTCDLLFEDRYVMECRTSHVEAVIIPRNQSTNIVHLTVHCVDNSSLLTLLRTIVYDLLFVRSLTLVGCETSLNDIISVGRFHDLKHLSLVGARSNLSDSTKLSKGLASLGELVSLNISDSSLSEMPSLCSQSELVFLNMSGNGLSSVSSPYRNCTAMPHTMMGAKLRVLDLSRNSLSELDPWIDSRTRFVTDLYVNSNMLDEHDLKLLINFRNLSRLDLSDNVITVLPNTSFIHNTRLVNLNISYNLITRLESGALSGLSDLEYLYLSHNQLSVIQHDVFADLLRLKRLDLGFNSFSLLPLHVFDPLQSLKRLILGNNNLTDLPTFRHLDSLLALNLRNNKISSLKTDTFLSLTQLQGLSLKGNLLTTMFFETFDFSPNLYLLDLSYNNISSLDRRDRKKDLSNIAKVTYLRLDNNQLVDIFLIGKHFSSLNYLFLDNNLIRTINRNSFPQSVKILTLSDNRISRITSYVFKYMYQLESVTLQRNYPYFSTLNQWSVEVKLNLEPKPKFYIGGNLFICDCKMGYVKAWDVGRNRISALRRYYPTFSDMQDVYCITLYDNVATPFRDVPMSHFVCGYYNGGHCGFGCNCCLQTNCSCDYTCPTNCSCYYGGSRWINEVYERIHCDNASLSQVPLNIPSNATHLYLGGNQIHSLSTGSFFYLKQVQYVYLNSSGIMRIGSQVFQGMNRLEVLFLDHNMICELLNESFSGLHALKELHLEHNNISYIEDGTFSMLNNLKHLFLENNRLTTISVVIFSHLENPPTIMLLSNPWSCDCQSMVVLKKFMNVYGSLVDRANELQCYWVFNPTSGTNIVKNNSENTNSAPTESGIPVLQYDYEEICSDNNSTVNVYVAHVVFLDDGRHVAALSTLVVIIAILVAVMTLAYWKRQEIQVWIFVKFGRRVFNKNNNLNEAGRQYDAFVSYSSKDEHVVVHELAPRLEGGDNSYKLCLHYRDFPVGECIADTIVNSIEASKRTLMLVSENFLRSEWCRYEFQTAHHHILKENTHRLIMILLHDLDPEQIDPDLRVHLKTGNFIKYNDPWFWEKLYFALPDRNAQAVRDDVAKADDVEIEDDVAVADDVAIADDDDDDVFYKDDQMNEMHLNMKMKEFREFKI